MRPTGKRLGITPELIEQSERLAEQLTLQAAQKPHLVQRCVVVLIPKARLFDWHNQWSARLKGSPAADPLRDRESFARAYLLAPTLDGIELERFIESHRQFFLDGFVNGYSPRTMWPWTPTRDEFHEWFEVIAAHRLWDMETGSLEKEPDVAGELMAHGNRIREQSPLDPENPDQEKGGKHGGET